MPKTPMDEAAQAASLADAKTAGWPRCNTCGCPLTVSERRRVAARVRGVRRLAGRLCEAAVALELALGGRP